MILAISPPEKERRGPDRGAGSARPAEAPRHSGGEKQWGTGEAMLEHDHFMGLALEQARLAYSAAEVPVGAVLVAGSGEVIAAAHNAPVSLHDPTGHAEILVLRKASRDLKNYRLPGTTLYVTLEPCIMCLGAMFHARVERLFYGAADPKAGAAGGIVDLTNAPVLNHHVLVSGGVRSDDCAKLLRDFFRERRRLRKEASEGLEGEVPKRP